MFLSMISWSDCGSLPPGVSLEKVEKREVVILKTSENMADQKGTSRLSKRTIITTNGTSLTDGEGTGYDRGC